MIKNTRFSKISSLVLVAICFCNFIYGQDMVIGYNGDTIKCKVTRIDTNIVNIITKTNNGPVEYSVTRNTIKELIVPVLPDDPARMKYERNIEIFSTTGIITGISAALGIALSIKGMKDILNGFQPAVDGVNSDTFNNGFIETGFGLPIAIAGTIVGFISLSRVLYNKTQLKKLYNLSFNMDYNTTYKGITLSYKF